MSNNFILLNDVMFCDICYIVFYRVCIIRKFINMRLR